MMAEEGGRRVSVISPRFCVPNLFGLSISERVWRGNFEVKDLNGNLIFKLDRPSFSTRKLMTDAAGLPILTLRPKSCSGRSRWGVFRGESAEEREMIFSARRSSMFGIKKIHVFLAANISEDVPDYTMVQGGNMIHPTCVVYVGDSSTVIAQMQGSSSQFRVTVNPNIDYAFIGTLIVILEEINNTE